MNFGRGDQVRGRVGQLQHVPDAVLGHGNNLAVQIQRDGRALGRGGAVLQADQHIGARDVHLAGHRPGAGIANVRTGGSRQGAVSGQTAVGGVTHRHQRTVGRGGGEGECGGSVRVQVGEADRIVPGDRGVNEELNFAGSILVQRAGLDAGGVIPRAGKRAVPSVQIHREGGQTGRQIDVGQHFRMARAGGAVRSR